MSRRFTLLLFAVLATSPGFAATAFAHPHPEDTGKATTVDRAVAVLQPIGRSGVSGTVHFVKQGEQVKVKGRITGLTPGKHGFHIHEFGDLTDMEAGKSAGNHYNPTDMPHGHQTDQQRHLGDLGNIEANEAGVATFEFTDPILQLNGPHTIVGRGLVVHAEPDKFTQPQGDAGDRAAMGVIGIAQPDK